MKSQTLTKLLEPTEAEITACLRAGAEMGLSRADVGRFFAETDRLPTEAEMSKLATGYDPGQAITMAAFALRPGPEPSFFHVKKSVWRPDAPKGAPWVVAYATLEVSAQTGRVQRILDLRVHDGDDRLWAARDADGKIVKLTPDGGFFQLSMTVARSEAFRAPHVMPDNVQTATWPNRADGEGFKDFETNQQARAMWFVSTVLRPLHEAWIGKPADELQTFAADAAPEVLMPEPTQTELLAAENAALRTQLAGLEELSARLAALEARR